MKILRRLCTLFVVLTLAGFAHGAKPGGEERRIVIGPKASGMEQLAAKELQRYLWQVTGTFLEIRPGAEPGAGSIVVGRPESHPWIGKQVAVGELKVSGQEPGPQGYVLKHVKKGEAGSVLVIAGSDEVGCLYGVYGLLEEHFGLSFGVAGDVLPDEKKALDLPMLDERHAPSVAIRGVLPWSIFPQTTNYSWVDWKSVIDQMAKMRLNLLMVHNYNGDSHGVNELYHNFPIDGKLPRVGVGHAKGGYMIGGPAWNPWEYRFKGRDLIDDCDFGAEAMIHGESLSNEELFARGVTMFQRVIAYAHTRGVKIALGTDVNLTLKGNAERADGVQRGKMAAEPSLVKARIGQVIRDYPDLDYFIAFSWEGMPKTAETLPIWEGIVPLIRQELKEKAPNIGLAVSSWSLPPEFVAGLPADVICAPIAGYSAKPQDGAIFGTRDYWACPWMEKDCDSCMFYYPFRLDLSDTIDAWQRRSSNTKGLYALTWRLTDAIDAKLWYIAHAPWDAQNKMKTSRDAYHAYAVANYGPAAAEAVTPIINQNEAFAANLCEMGGPRPFREFAAIMHSWPVVTFKGLEIARGEESYRRAAVDYDHNNGGKRQKVGTPDAFVDQISSGYWFVYRNADFGAGADEVTIQAATDRGARVEFRLGDADGPLLGQGVIPRSKGWEVFQTVHVPIRRTSGKQTLCVAFSDEVYPRKELAKAEQQLAVVDASMAQASPGQRQRLDLLRTRLAAVRDHIRLNLEFPEYKLEDLPGAMESWVMNYIRRVDDISSLGTMTSIQGRFVQHTYLREKVESFYASQPIRPPLDVEARGTLTGAQITWRDTDASGKVTGYRVYRDGQLLTKQDLPAAQCQFEDSGSGEFTYTVTAIGPNGKESLPSVKSRCLAGAADKEPPFIVMISPPLSATMGQPVEIKARVVDGRSYESITATLHYRQPGTQEWKKMGMTRRVRAIFTATLTPELLGLAGVEYYIEASDGSNASRFPLAAPNRNLSLILEKGPVARKLPSPKVTATKGALAWQEVPGTHWYKIYRGRTPHFTAGPDTYLTFAAAGTRTFKDLEEDFDGTERQGTFYYRVAAMDRNGFEGSVSRAVAVASGMVLKPATAALAGGVSLARSSQSASGWVATGLAKAGEQILFKSVPNSSGLRIRYSNGNTSSTRCGLYVGNQRVATLTFPVTHSQEEDAQNYANGVRLANGAAPAAGSWNAFATLEVRQNVEGALALRIDPEDAQANQGKPCCNIERLEIEPSNGK